MSNTAGGSTANTSVDLAKLVAERTGSEIDYVSNPRAEAAENELHVRNNRFLELGLEPPTRSEELLEEVTEISREVRPPLRHCEDTVYLTVDI